MTVQVKGVLRVIAKPLVGRIPIVADVSLCFLEQPVSGVFFKQFYTNHVYCCQRRYRVNTVDDENSGIVSLIRMH